MKILPTNLNLVYVLCNFYFIELVRIRRKRNREVDNFVLNDIHDSKLMGECAMERYQAPANYLMDDNSGLYYNKMIITDKYGNSVCHTIWFNAETGEYSQVSSPMKQSSCKNKNTGKKSMIAIGCTLFILIFAFLIMRGLALGTDTVLTSTQVMEELDIYTFEDTTLSPMLYEGNLVNEGVMSDDATSDDQ